MGALFIREGVDVEPLLHGADHEAGRRASTENVLEIVGLGAACRVASVVIENEQTTKLRDHLWQSLVEQFRTRVSFNGHPKMRLPNTLNVSFSGYVGGEILSRLPEVAASTGSACHAGSAEMSPVLRAMGIEATKGLGAIRFSLGRGTTVAEINRVVELLAKVVT